MKYRPFFAALGAGAAVMLLLPWMAAPVFPGHGRLCRKRKKKTVEPSPCDGGAVCGRCLDYVQSL